MKASSQTQNGCRRIVHTLATVSLAALVGFAALPHVARADVLGPASCADWVSNVRPDLAGFLSGPPATWPLEAFQEGFMISNQPSLGALVVMQPGVDSAGPSGSTGYVVEVDNNGWFQVIDPGKRCSSPKMYRWEHAHWGVSFIP
ncbi:MAG: hypothetical protein M1296_04145 [Chloroflexi bacterium]|nr:hypothetical protein [Chloroflexota bacterium]